MRFAGLEVNGSTWNENLNFGHIRTYMGGLLQNSMSNAGNTAMLMSLPYALAEQKKSEVGLPGYMESALGAMVGGMTPPSDPKSLAEWGMGLTGPMAAGTMVRNIGSAPVQSLSKEVPSADVLRKKFLELMEKGKSQNRGLLEETKFKEAAADKGKSAAEEAFLKDRAWKAKLNDLEIHYGAKRLF